jgi:hypothetical protein
MTDRSKLVLRHAVMDVMCSTNPGVRTAQVRLRRALIESREPDEHPEDLCEECREPFEAWHAPTEDWESVTGRGWGGPILCEGCFNRRLRATVEREL